MELGFAVSNMIMNNLLLSYGASDPLGSDGALAVMRVLSAVGMFTIMPSMGIAMGAQPIIGYNYGARKFGRMKRTLGQGMMDGGLRLVSGGTDNHLCLVDLTPADVTGKDAEKLLESVGLTVNKNSIPNEPRSPFVTSGIRVGSAAATTRGFTADDFYEVGQLIAATVFNAESEAKLADVRAKVDALLAAHPLYPELDY